MKEHNKKYIWTFVLLAITAVFMIVSVPCTALSDQVPKLGVKDSKRIVPNNMGFIQRWLLLEPIAASGDTQTAVQATVKSGHFTDELTILPKEGDKVSVNSQELTWQAVDTDEYNVNLYYFAELVGTNCNNSLFWAVTYINCPEEVKDVRLAVGSNSASVWWVNGEEVIGIYGNRCTVVDDGVSKRLTLKKGINVIRGGIINASGAADFCARILDSSGNPLKGYTVSLTKDAAIASAGSSEFPIKLPLKWKASGKLLSPKPDDGHPSLSVKDPTIVYYEGKWHVYATSAMNGGWSMQYFSFSDWSEAPDAMPTYIDVNPGLRGYHCAPHLFYFTPHKKWYLVFQSQQPQYCTSDDITDVTSWTAPKDFFEGKPASLGRNQWIDYHLISDGTYMYLFFTGDDGRFWRSRTKIEDFPNGMSDPELAIQDSRDNLFEGSITYKIKGSDYYMTLIEALSPTRYYRAWISKDLNGEWTPLEGANSFDTPFAGRNNVTFEDGVESWTREFSHGEMLRDGYDEKMIIDPENLKFLFQGNDTTATSTRGGRGGRGGGGGYNSLPYRLGIITAEK
ncbi:MAG: hypothetical protein JXA96_17905 [Sedimentisphaerales bacterium]|nr:hypothetical protein [Sedimentisphaerales bacterium]